VLNGDTVRSGNSWTAGALESGGRSKLHTKLLGENVRCGANPQRRGEVEEKR